ncbi:plasma protease C1 inhibitor isoform X3 [Podarcis muralis]
MCMCLRSRGACEADALPLNYSCSPSPKRIFATMKIWLILLGLAATLIPSFSQEVPKKTITEAENEGPEPTQTTNNGGWNWPWNIFGQEVPKKSIREAENDGPELTQTTNNGGWNWPWNIFGQEVPKKTITEAENEGPEPTQTTNNGGWNWPWNIFGQEVPKKSIREAENDGPELTQTTNNGGWNWPWNIFGQEVPKKTITEAENEGPEPTQTTNNGGWNWPWNIFGQEVPKKSIREAENDGPELTQTTNNGGWNWPWNIFGQEVPKKSIREAENDRPEPTQTTNNGGWNWRWNIFGQGSEVTEEPTRATRSTNNKETGTWRPLSKILNLQDSQGIPVENEDDATVKLEEGGERENEGSHEQKEATHLEVASNKRDGGAEGNECKQSRISEVGVKECLDDPEIPAGTTNTTEPATRIPTTAEAMTSTPCTSKQCQPRINPWATCARATTEDEKKLFEALTEFSVEFYKAAILHEKPGSNLIFSPFSVAVMLSNLLLGTCNQTKDRLERLLFYPEGFTCVHRALESLQKSESLTSANAMFFQPALPLENDFRNLTRMFYKTKLAHLTNNSNQDVADINSWVSQSTNKKIKKIVNELDSDAKMILLNAVYFYSKWKEMFLVKDTKKAKFYRPGLAPINVQMMMSKKYPMASFIDHSLQAKVGRLQLSNNMSLVIIMPSSITQNLTEVEERLSAVVFKSVMAKLESTHFKPTVVYLPRFKADTSQNLMNIIGEMDFGFFYDADLCEISTDKELAVSSAHHRAVLEISEEGVEAAAATVVSLARTANIFEVSQPFLVAVMRDNGFPVFMGRINNPQAA